MEKVFEQVCPNCGKDDLDFDIIEPQDEFMTQKVSCRGCGYDFTIWSESTWMYDTE